MSSAFCWAWPIDPGEQLVWFLQLPWLVEPFTQRSSLLWTSLGGGLFLNGFLSEGSLGLAEKTVIRRRQWAEGLPHKNNTSTMRKTALKWSEPLNFISCYSTTGRKTWSSINSFRLWGRDCFPEGDTVAGEMLVYLVMADWGPLLGFIRWCQLSSNSDFPHPHHTQTGTHFELLRALFKHPLKPLSAYQLCWVNLLSPTTELFQDKDLSLVSLNP